MTYCDGVEDAPKADRAWPYRSCFASIQTSMIETGLEKTKNKRHCLDEVQRNTCSTQRDRLQTKGPSTGQPNLCEGSGREQRHGCRRARHETKDMASMSLRSRSRVTQDRLWKY